MQNEWNACPMCGTLRPDKNNNSSSTIKKLDSDNKAIIETSTDRGIATLSHYLGAFSGFLFPVIIYLVKSDSVIKEDPVLHSHLMESVNASVSFSTAMTCYLVLMPYHFEIALILAFWHFIFQVFNALFASDKLRKGKLYKYPLTYRIL